MLANVSLRIYLNALYSPSLRNNSTSLTPCYTKTWTTNRSKASATRSKLVSDEAWVLGSVPLEDVLQRTQHPLEGMPVK